MSEPRFSFVIPVLNEAPALAELLPLLAREFPRAERVVVDGGSSDKSVATAMPQCHQLLLSGSGRALQMNLGGRAATGTYLLFLHADTRPLFGQSLLDGWAAGEPLWGFCKVRLSGSGRALRLVEWAMNQRSRRTRIATGDQMLMVRRDWFLEGGGYREQPLMEDVQMSARLRRCARPKVAPGTVQTSSRRWEERGVWRTVLEMWGLRLAYFLGVSPARLHGMYYRG